MSRENFENSWINESPYGIKEIPTYKSLSEQIKDLIDNGMTPVDIGNGLMKIDMSQLVYYWYQSNDGKIILGVGLEKKPQALEVFITGKSPDIYGEPYASELYKNILKNTNKSVRLRSDQTMSEDGKKIWKRLIDDGVNVSIYDAQNPGQTFNTFTNPSQIDHYFSYNDSDFKRYRYVLSDDGEMLAETRAFFLIRKFREQTKGLL
jgi:hypothetical protein